MGIDVVHFAGSETGAAKGFVQRPCVTDTLGMRIGRMVGLAALTMPGYLSVDARPATERVREVLHHEKRGTFPKQKSVPCAVEGTHRLRRFAGLLRHGPQPAESHMQHLHGLVRPACHGHVNVVTLYHAGSVTEGVSAGSAARAISDRVTLNSQVQANGAAAFAAIRGHQIVGMERAEI